MKVRDNSSILLTDRTWFAEVMAKERLLLPHFRADTAQETYSGHLGG